MKWESLVIDSTGLFCTTETKEVARTGVRRIQRSVVSGLGLALLAFSVVPAFADGTAESANTFKKICSACHTFGKGIKVGPDLKGVTERRQRSWLLKFVRSSQTVIQAGDPTAKSLFEQFKQQKMPDRSDLTDQQISALMDYLADNGPEKKPADERLADTATPAEIETGRKLFFGEMPLAFGGQACSSCHSIGGSGFKGGTLGPNLTNTFIKYQDKAMTDFLRHPCFLRVPETPGNYLKLEESFALKSYLAQSAGIKANPVQPAPNSKGAPSASNSVSVPAAQSDQKKRGTP